MKLCIDCKKTEVRTKESTRCRSCGLKFAWSSKKQSVSAKKEKRKIYAAQYFQKNKEKIYQKIKLNPPTKESTKKYNFKYLYNLSMEEFNELLYIQQGRCWICRCLFNNIKKKAMVDHNHSTNKVRGLLCHSCNVAIGLLKDNIGYLQNAINYLKD
jgi:hypothetical protein